MNKLSKIATKSLKSIITEFYSTEEVNTAKGLLLDSVLNMKIENFPKSIRRRRDSASNKSTLFDEIVATIHFLDENGHKEKLPTFVADHTDHMPSSKLMEGEMDLLWGRMDRLEGYIKQVCDGVIFISII